MAFKNSKLTEGHGFDYYQFCKSQHFSEALDFEFNSGESNISLQTRFYQKF
jgi:hypothetical protein